MARTKNFDESEVLNSALALFWKKGYNATSIQDLVDTLGINRASIYGTWGDKHNLYLEALKRYRQQTSSWLLQQIRSEQSALGIIRDFMMSMVEQSLQDTEQKGCFIVNSTTELANRDVQVRNLCNEHRRTVEKVLNELIKEGQESHEITTAHSSEALSKFVFNSISGLRVIAKGGYNENDLKVVVDVTLSALN